MCSEEYHWHYDYVRLAWDEGFCFEKYKSRNVDKNKICLVDVDRIVKERDIASVERYIPLVVRYILEDDQADVLDTNFVKMFRMSQLSVEYLQFCKKYLDNTVVLLKKEVSRLKEENKGLKSYIREAENNYMSIVSNDLVAAFRCDRCSKVFSSEKYLTLHVKKRHSDDVNASVVAETDKLHSEIKELKERLNITEKMLQEKGEKAEESKTDLKVDESKIKIDEIQEQFDKFRERVENDLKMLQVERNFYEERYNKLFDVIQSSKENVNDIKESESKEQIEKNWVENATQTDAESPKEFQIVAPELERNIIVKDKSNSDELEEKINIEKEIEDKVNKIGETVEYRIRTFMEKVTELEQRLEVEQERRVEYLPKQPTETFVPQYVIPKPEIKPRSKFQVPNLMNPELTSAEKPRKLSDKFYGPSISSLRNESNNQLTKVEPPKVPPDNNSQSSETKSEIESSETDEEETESSENEEVKPRGIDPALQINSKTLEEHIATMNRKIQSMGISPSWSGIPENTYARALEIVKYHESLSRLNLPQWDSVKKSLENVLDKKYKDLNVPGLAASEANVLISRSQKNVINISYKKKPKESEATQEPKNPIVSIKNRSIYDTDTESEPLQPKRSNEAQTYSAVIEELKTSRLQNVDDGTELNPVDASNGNKNELYTRGVLKNFPSVGSLTKKKVLFDIESDESKIEDDVPIVQAVGGSTTSVASSVLDKTQNVEEGNEESEGSLSDFDFCDL